MKKRMLKLGISQDGEFAPSGAPTLSFGATESTVARCVDVKAHLRDNGFYNEEKGRGQSYTAYRVKKVFAKNCRPNIGLVR